MQVPHWLQAQPDSLAAWLSSGGRRRSVLWYPLLNLIWLFWMVAAPWAFGPARPWVLAATLASLPVFLALYHRAWLGPRRQLGRITGAIAVLGLAMVLVNTSWSYVIYAACFIPFAAPRRRAWVWTALLLSALYATAVWGANFPQSTAVVATVMTAVLALMNFLTRSNQERDAELRLTQDEVRRLATAAERERIARDLHDLLGHTWSLVAVKAELARKLLARDTAAAARELAEIEQVARQSLAQVRDAVSGMRAPVLAAELASARLLLEAAHIALHPQGFESPPPLAPAAEAALALGLREAVTNVQRHARASQVRVQLESSGTHAELGVHDDGRGTGSRRGNGLAGMEERLKAVGGSLLLESNGGRGTRLQMRVPLATGGEAGLA